MKVSQAYIRALSTECREEVKVPRGRKRGTKIMISIDCENVSYRIIDTVMKKATAMGNVVSVKAFGRVKEFEQHSPWTALVRKYGILPMVHIQYKPMKNQLDMLLMMDAIESHYTETFDIFMLVAYDQDYIPLVNWMRAHGKRVVGVGPFMACDFYTSRFDQFIHLDLIEKRVNFDDTGKPEARCDGPEEDDEDDTRLTSLPKVCPSYNYTDLVLEFNRAMRTRTMDKLHRMLREYRHGMIEEDVEKVIKMLIDFGFITVSGEGGIIWLRDPNNPQLPVKDVSRIMD